MVIQNYARRVMRIIFISLLMGAFLSIFGPLGAQEKDEREIMRTREISGEVSVIRPRYVSIVYERDEKKGAEYEMMFPINKDVKFTRRDLDEIKVGDQVSVKYNEYYKIEENEETGEEKEQFVRRATKEVKFIRPGLKGKLISR